MRVCQNPDCQLEHEHRKLCVCGWVTVVKKDVDRQNKQPADVDRVE